jgi:small multidrug resistance pump
MDNPSLTLVQQEWLGRGSSVSRITLRAVRRWPVRSARRFVSSKKCSPMIHWLYLTIAIVAEVVGTSFLRASEGFTKLVPSVLVIAGYGLAFFFLSLTLKDIPVGIAYAIWSGAGVTLITAIGWTFFGQKLDAPAILGMGLIVAGVIMLNVFSKASAH